METKIKLLEPLKQFYCDRCGRLIEQAEAGWVEFLSEPNGIGRLYYGFRIVHHSGKCGSEKGCLRHFHRHGAGSIELDQFTGKNGINELLDFLDEGDVLEPSFRGSSVKDMREFVELARRLTVPYYEQARQYWQRALEDGWFDSNIDGIYGEATLKALIADYSKPGVRVLRF